MDLELIDMTLPCVFFLLFITCRAFVVKPVENQTTDNFGMTSRYKYPPTTKRSEPVKLLNWPCCTSVRGYSRGGFCKDQCIEIAKKMKMDHVACIKGSCQCETYFHEEKGKCVPDPKVSFHVLAMIYLAGVPLLSIVLVVAAVMQYLFDRFCFTGDDTIAQGIHDAEDVESANAEDTEAGHRVQFMDGGRPECAIEYDWAYEDWHADNPEDKLSQMLMGALSKGSRKTDK